MKRYDVMIHNVKSGIDEKVDQITASSVTAAKRLAMKDWYSQINLIYEQIVIIENDHQKPMVDSFGRGIL